MTGMPRSPRSALRFVAAVVVLTSLAACAGDDDASPTTLGDTIPLPTADHPDTTVSPTDVPTLPSTAAPTSPPTTPPASPPTRSEATAATTSGPPTTAVSTTAAPTGTTVPTSATDVPAASVARPTTTEPLAVQELLLRDDGIGAAAFGDEPEGVIEYVTSILGGTTDDTGWVDPFTFAACDGTTARRVDWGVLRLLFSDLSDAASGREHFIGWEYGSVSELGGEPVGLRTPGGTTVGSRVVDLEAEFPDVTINDAEDALDIPNYYLTDDFRGLLTGTTDDDLVVYMSGGYGCGE